MAGNKSGPGGGSLRSIGELLAKSPSLKRDDKLSWWVWLDVVGERVAARSIPERLEPQALWVAVEGSAWAAELSLLAPTILERLRAKGVKVNALRFRVGSVSVPRRPVPLAPPELKALPAGLQERLKLLDHDPALQAAIANAARLIGSD